MKLADFQLKLAARHSSLLILASVVLFSCQSNAIKPIDPYPLLNDQSFPSFQTVEIETEEQVFSINQEIKNFISDNVSRHRNSYQRIEALSEAIFHHSNLDLLYQNDANTTANETFKNKTANCLSLTIMTYAMADYANIGVRFQQIDVPETWVIRNGQSLLNRHVNLRLYQQTESNVILYDNKNYQLDFDQSAQAFGLPSKIISKQRVLAMFYNNKGADALVKGQYNEAYAYFRAAVITDNLLIEAWSNLGVLYRRLDQLEKAEQVYLQALEIDSNDLTTLDNLAYIYEVTNRRDQARFIQQRLIRERKMNPYYHFMLGDIKYQTKNWTAALVHYKKAISLNKKVTEFYYSIAKTYSQLKDIESSQRYLKLAQKYARNESDQLIYQSKIDKLIDRD